MKEFIVRYHRKGHIRRFTRFVTSECVTQVISDWEEHESESAIDDPNYEICLIDAVYEKVV